MMQDHKLKRLFVIGGDGTMHEVINGLKGTDQIELTFVPAGSYNDFSKGLGIKKSALLQEIKSLHRPLTRKFFAGNINFFMTQRNHFILLTTCLSASMPQF